MVPVSKSTCSSAPPPISGSACHSSVTTLETNTPGCTSIAASSLAVTEGHGPKKSLRNQRLLRARATESALAARSHCCLSSRRNSRWASGRRHLGELRCVVPDRVPAGLVGDLLVKARGEFEVAHQPCGHEVLRAEVVIEARSAVAAEVAGRELALVALDQVLALGEPEVLRGHYDPCKARARPPLAATAVTVTQCLGVLNLVLDTAAQASSLERFSHRTPTRVVVERFAATLPPSRTSTPEKPWLPETPFGRRPVDDGGAPQLGAHAAIVGTVATGSAGKGSAWRGPPGTSLRFPPGSAAAWPTWAWRPLRAARCALRLRRKSTAARRCRARDLRCRRSRRGSTTPTRACRQAASKRSASDAADPRCPGTVCPRRTTRTRPSRRARRSSAPSRSRRPARMARRSDASPPACRAPTSRRSSGGTCAGASTATPGRRSCHRARRC